MADKNITEATAQATTAAENTDNTAQVSASAENVCPADAKREAAKEFGKETFFEFVRSLIIGVFPTGTDYVFSTLVFYLFCTRAMGLTFWGTLFSSPELTPAVSVAGTAVGYILGAVVAYIFSVVFVYKHKEKGRTVKGALLFCAVEGFAFGFNLFLGWLFNLFMNVTFAFALRICVSYIVVFLLRKLLIFKK